VVISYAALLAAASGQCGTDSFARAMVDERMNPVSTEPLAPHIGQGKQ